MRKQIIRNMAKDDEFTVEEIIGKRRRGNRVEYLVKWQDYSEDESTWEPIENLINVWELIEDYEKGVMEEEKASKKNIKPKTLHPNAIQQPQIPQRRLRTFSRRHDASDFEYEDDVDEEEETLSRTKEHRSNHLNANSFQNQIEGPKEIRGNESRLDGRMVWLQKDNFQKPTPKSSRIKPSNPKLIRSIASFEPELKISSDEEENAVLPDLGDFRYGDHARQIISCKPRAGDIVVTVEWHPRANKTVPKNTSMSTNVLKKYDPELLIDYYETKLRFVPKDDEIREGDETKVEHTNVIELECKDKAKSSDEKDKGSEKEKEKSKKKGLNMKTWGTKEIEA